MNLGWYARRLASMSPAEMAGRTRDELTKRRWRARQVTDAAADPADVPAACPPFAARRSLASRRLEAVTGNRFAGPEPAPTADEGAAE